MISKNVKRQRQFKARMYERGYRQVQTWVLKDSSYEMQELSRSTFIKKLDELTLGWENEKLSDLFCELLKVVNREKLKAEIKEKQT